MLFLPVYIKIYSIFYHWVTCGFTSLLWKQTWNRSRTVNKRCRKGILHIKETRHTGTYVGIFLHNCKSCWSCNYKGFHTALIFCKWIFVRRKGQWYGLKEHKVDKWMFGDKHGMKLLAWVQVYLQLWFKQSKWPKIHHAAFHMLLKIWVSMCP